MNRKAFIPVVAAVLCFFVCGCTATDSRVSPSPAQPATKVQTEGLLVDCAEVAGVLAQLDGAIRDAFSSIVQDPESTVRRLQSARDIVVGLSDAFGEELASPMEEVVDSLKRLEDQTRDAIDGSATFESLTGAATVVSENVAQVAEVCDGAAAVS